MKFAVTLALLVGLVVADAVLDPKELDEAFSKFKETFGRSYESKFEERQRKLVFASNYELILKHNAEADAGLHTYRMGVNKFSDLTNKEFRAFYNGFKPSLKKPGKLFEPNPRVALNATVDWTTKGVVTPVKNQLQCGSCWAFSAVASMEGQHALKTGQLVSLSEQNLIDCSRPEGNMGCEGGLMDQAFDYVMLNSGIDTEASYPYQAIDDTCRFKKRNVGATISSYADIASGNEQALKQAVGTIGPISVAVDASNFQSYASGIFNDPDCSTSVLDHGVTAVGYGELNGVAYWKVKNSWGTDWGEQGYILMSRNKENQCGIATMASYPIV